MNVKAFILENMRTRDGSTSGKFCRAQSKVTCTLCIYIYICIYTYKFSHLGFRRKIQRSYGDINLKF